MGPVRPLQLQMHLHLHPTAGAQGHRDGEGDREGEDHANRTRKEKEKEKHRQGDLSLVVLHSPSVRTILPSIFTYIPPTYISQKSFGPCSSSRYINYGSSSQLVHPRWPLLQCEKEKREKRKEKRAKTVHLLFLSLFLFCFCWQFKPERSDSNILD